MRWGDLFWPTLEKPTDMEKAREASALARDREQIDQAKISEDEQMLIDEARRLADSEMDRRKTAETKAAIYLTIVGVLSPILATIAPEALEPKSGWPRLVVTLAIFLCAGAYLLRCGLWALHAISVKASTRIDAVDLVRLWALPDRKAALARQLMLCVRLDRAGVNEKVTSIIMAQAFAIRAFALCVLAMVVRSGWKPISQVFDQIGRLLV